MEETTQDVGSSELFSVGVADEGRRIVASIISNWGS
jgi:hypothetical protein